MAIVRITYFHGGWDGCFLEVIVFRNGRKTSGNFMSVQRVAIFYWKWKYGMWTSNTMVMPIVWVLARAYVLLGSGHSVLEHF